MTELVCLHCKQGFQDGEERIPVTLRTNIAVAMSQRLPAVPEPKRGAVHPACFDPDRHDYNG
jgi:hypothetical protein